MKPAAEKLALCVRVYYNTQCYHTICVPGLSVCPFVCLFVFLSVCRKLGVESGSGSYVVCGSRPQPREQ